MAPDNGWLEDEISAISFWDGLCRGELLIFGEGIITHIKGGLNLMISASYRKFAPKKIRQLTEKHSTNQDVFPRF